MDADPLSVQNDSCEGPSNEARTLDNNLSHNHDASGLYKSSAQRRPGMPRGTTPSGPIHKCNCGAKGTKQSHKWVKCQAPHIMVTEKVEGILVRLAAAHWESETYDVQQWLVNVGGALYQVEDTYKVDSLSSIVTHCHCLSKKSIDIGFLLMVNLIQLVTKCQR